MHINCVRILATTASAPLIGILSNVQSFFLFFKREILMYIWYSCIISKNPSTEHSIVSWGICTLCHKSIYHFVNPSSWILFSPNRIEKKETIFSEEAELIFTKKINYKVALSPWTSAWFQAVAVFLPLWKWILFSFFLFWNKDRYIQFKSGATLVNFIRAFFNSTTRLLKEKKEFELSWN